MQVLAPHAHLECISFFTQVSLSVYCAIFGFPVVWSFIEHPFGVNLSMSADKPLNKALHYCICVHFLSKFLDYVDTTLIIIGKTNYPE